MLLEAANKYFSDENDKDLILNDDEYDILREYIIKKYPKNKIALEQHTQIKLGKDKVKLPYEMWSMNKIKADINEINKFKKKYNGPYVISAKLDGVSALYSSENNEYKLYTRGNGTYGQNIDHLIKYLNLPKIENITVRGELMIKENIFKEKYENSYSNSRNFISGLVNRKKISKEDEKMFNNIDFVAYELIVPENLKPSVQLNKLLEYNFITAKFINNITEDNFTNEFLSKNLQEWRDNYEYTIDGLVCGDDNIYKRESKNPEHAFAFKMILTEDMIEAKVIDILWNPSKNGLLKPTVKFEPVKLSNKTITFSTGDNARAIVNKKIGLGAIVKLKLAGFVIPNIDSVIKPADKPLMPNEEYVWNETNVDIMVVNKKDNEVVKMKNILNFFKTLEVEGIGEQTVKKIMNTGNNNIGKIIGMSKEEFLKVDGFKEKLANKIYNGIQEKIKDSSIEELAAASNIFGKGFGKLTMEKILDNEPKILIDKDLDENKFKKLININGIGNKIAQNFIENIENFKIFLEDGKLMYKLEEKIKKKVENLSKKNENLPYFGELIILSEVKNKKKIEEKVIELGGNITGNMSK
jgi:DNA ligase (NAD+)